MSVEQGVAAYVQALQQKCNKTIEDFIGDTPLRAPAAAAGAEMSKTGISFWQSWKETTPPAR